MTPKSTKTYQFGDLLALARQSWLGQMAGALDTMGYHDYRRSDAAAVRRLQRGPMAIGRLGTTLGVSRQTARKVATGLERRGFATTVRDTNDSRQINVTLTADGEEYAKALTKVIDRLNRDLYRRVDPVDLAGADAVLRAVLVDDHTRKVAQYLAPP